MRFTFKLRLQCREVMLNVKHRDQRVCFDFGVSRFKKCTTEKVFDCCAKNEDNFCREDALDLEPKF